MFLRNRNLSSKKLSSGYHSHVMGPAQVYNRSRAALHIRKGFFVRIDIESIVPLASVILIPLLICLIPFREMSVDYLLSIQGIGNIALGIPFELLAAGGDSIAGCLTEKEIALNGHVDSGDRQRRGISFIPSPLTRISCTGKKSVSKSPSKGRPSWGS